MVALIAALTMADYRARFPLPDATVPSGWGVNIHFTHPEPGEMEMIRDAGFRWMRMDLFWHQIERERGRYDFSAYDVLVESADKHGLRLLFILDYGNDLYQKGSPSTPEARAAFCRFVEAAVRRYRGKGILWEMWNEPNIHFWQPVPNVDDYVALALEVGRTIRRVAPEEWYVGPATSGFDWRFLQTCFQRGLLEYFDAVTVHPYRGIQPESVLPDWFRLRELIDRFSPKGRRIPMLSGEWGYSELYSGLDQRIQSRWAPRQYLVNLAGGANLSIWYDWKNDGTDPKEVEHHFGTVYHDLRPKPTYTNIQATARALAGFRFDKRLDQGDPEEWALLFVRGSEQRIARWTSRTGSDTLPAIEPASLPAAVVRWPRLPLGTRAAKPAELASVLAWSGAPSEARLRVEALPPDGRAPRFAVESKPDAASLGKALASARGFQAPHAEVWRLRLGLLLPGGAHWQAMQWHPAHPFRVAFASPEANSVWALFDAGSEQPNEPVRVSARAGGAQAQISLLDRPARFPGLRAPEGAELAATVEVEGKALPMPRIGFLRVPTDSTSGWQWVADGDAKVRAELSLSADAPPSGLPFRAGRALRLRYAFGQGWRFAELRPASPIALPAGAANLALWVHGDGSGNILRLRFQDETGQTHQPDGPRIDWKGWRLVSIPLRAGYGGFWGGAQDGKVHGRCRLTTALLVDSVPPRENSGELWIAGVSIAHAR
ncbi:MAG: hypothetical protein N2109_09035 [Fimbriimonadales bacterium]|nr:hypothetical protein [Fimbriimonadales bacterium]